MADTVYGQLLKIQQSGGGLNPVQQSQFDQLKASGQTALTTDGSGGASDPLALAQQAQQLQVQANQPAIATLQGQQSSLQDQYSKLLDSITASEQPALNSAIGAANTNLAKRGITSTSAYGAENIAQNQLPVTTATGQQLSQTGVNEAQDLNSLAAQIASLQAGNVGNGLNFASGITNANTSANAAIQAAQIQGTSKPFAPVSPGQVGLNQSTGAVQLPSFLQ